LSYQTNEDDANKKRPRTLKFRMRYETFFLVMD
jgi:hypothetical protein